MRDDASDHAALSSRARGRRGAASRRLAVALAWALAALSASAASAAGPEQIALTDGLTSFELVAPAGRQPADCPLVVLVAGYAVPMVVWNDTVPALVARGFAVLRFDLYGRGQSSRPHVDYTPDLFAGQLHELVTRLAPRLKSPVRFHIVASSMGGVVAAVFASRHPDVVERVVLVSPAGLSGKFPPVLTLLKVPGLGPWYFRTWFKNIMLDHLHDNLLDDYRRYPDMLVEFHRQLAVPGSADAMYSTLRHTLLRDNTDDFRVLGGLHRPTRVVWGVEDHLVPFRDSRKALGSSIPHHQLCAVPRAAHLPQLEQPRVFNALVTQFLATDSTGEPFVPCEEALLK